jgi:hypothetical protein
MMGYFNLFYVIFLVFYSARLYYFLCSQNQNSIKIIYVINNKVNVYMVVGWQDR